MDEKLKNGDQQVLLVTENADPKALKAVTGIDKDGKLKTVNPTGSSLADFLVIDKHGNALENFFKKYSEQSKHPSHSGFYLMSQKVLDKLLKKQPIDEKALDPYRIDPQKFLEERKAQKQGQESGETPGQKTAFQPIDETKINWQHAANMGIHKEALEEAGQLKAMLYGHKSPSLTNVTFTLEGISFETQARLLLKEMPDGTYHFQPFSVLKEPELDKPFHGATLTDKDKENLLQSGNAGRVIELEPEPGEKIPALVSLDKITNRLEAVPVGYLDLPKSLKGVDLTDEQLDGLREGKPVLVEGMISKKSMDTDTPKKFDAYIQFNASKRSFDFNYDGLNKNKQQQTQGQNGQQVRVPQKLLGVDLSQKQQEDLRANKTIYVKGMVKDGQDQPFNAYIRINHEQGKLDFYKWNPEKAKTQGAEVTPANESKTQVAVNSEGKTNEATKHSKEPLKQGQQKPTENQQQQEAKKVVKKSQSVKM